MSKETLAALVSATRGAYGSLVNADTDAGDEATGPIYESLIATYASHGLDENTAVSSIDWYEGGTLIEDLTDALSVLQ
jgi:hypothetical protein